MGSIRTDEKGFLVGRGGKDVLEVIVDNTEQTLKAVQARSNLKDYTVTVKTEAQSSVVKSKPVTSDAVAKSIKKAQRTNDMSSQMRDAKGRFVQRQEKRTEDYRKEQLKLERNRNALLSEIAKKPNRGIRGLGRLNLLSSLGIGAGALLGLSKLPKGIFGVAKSAASLLGIGKAAAAAGAVGGMFSKKPSAPSSRISKGFGAAGKLLKGSLLAGLLTLAQGVDVERSNMSRGNKNKTHVKNLAGAAGGLAGAAAGAAIGQALIPIPVVGAVVGAVAGGFLGSELVDSAVEAIDKRFDPRISEKMFSSWRGFVEVSKSAWLGMTVGAGSAWKGVMNTAEEGAKWAWYTLVPDSWAGYFMTLSNISSSAWERVKEGSSRFWESTKTTAEKAWDAFSSDSKSFWERAWDAFKVIWDSFPSFGEIGQTIKDTATSAINFLKPSNLVSKTKDFFSQAESNTSAYKQQEADYHADKGYKVQKISEKAAKAAAHAVNNAASKSLGVCAQYVNNSLKSQGISSFGHGKDVAGNLIKSNQGFEEIEYSKDYVPQIGDVMSMPSHSGAGHNYGHVAIYTEKGWVSDFIQGNKYGNTAAANRKYFKEIQEGKIKPTIARKTNGKMINSPTVNGVVAGASTLWNKATGGLKGLLHKGESKIKGKEDGYDVANFRKGNGRFDLYKGTLRNKSIGEIKELQQSGKVFAAGKYQVIPSTLKEAQKALGFSDKDVFTPELQEQIGTWLITGKRKSIGEYLRTGKGLDTAMLDLSKEFSSVPLQKDTINHKGQLRKRGQSFYAGDKAQHKPEEIQRQMIEAHRRYNEARAQGYSDKIAIEYAVSALYGGSSFKSSQVNASAPSKVKTEPAQVKAVDASTVRSSSNGQSIAIKHSRIAHKPTEKHVSHPTIAHISSGGTDGNMK